MSGENIAYPRGTGYVDNICEPSILHGGVTIRYTTVPAHNKLINLTNECKGLIALCDNRDKFHT